MVPLIGLCGRRGVGKSSVARVLAAGGGSVVSFAHPIRALVAQVWHVAHRDLTHEDVKAAPLYAGASVTVRDALVEMGDAARRLDPDVWVTAAQREIQSTLSMGLGHVVVDDVRFVREAAMIRRLGGVVVYLSRGLDHGPTDEEAASAPPSERPWELGPSLLVTSAADAQGTALLVRRAVNAYYSSQPDAEPTYVGPSSPTRPRRLERP